MLRITIDLIPFGVESKTKHIGIIEVDNSGVVTEGTNYIYNYKGEIKTMNDKLVTYFFGGKFAHNREDNVLILLKRLLDDFLED